MTPYIFNTKTPDFELNQIIDKKLNDSFWESKNLSLTEVEQLIKLYTPAGFVKEYEITGHFVLPYPVDSPLTPALEIINNREYYYYQKIILDLQNIRQPIITGDLKYFVRQAYHFLTHKWYFDIVYNELINRPLLQFAYQTVFRSLDKGVLELFGPYGLSYVLFSGASKMKNMQSGYIYHYAYFMFSSLLIIIIIITFFL
jgi:NADH:ubiquinone oxidoreductase subunit 5 (subunit L)/multisubunit Na+/H+ antiporter MnhA subunit